MHAPAPAQAAHASRGGARRGTGRGEVGGEILIDGQVYLQGVLKPKQTKWVEVEGKGNVFKKWNKNPDSAGA